MEFYLSITGKTCIETPLKKDKSYSVIFKEVDIYGEDLRSGQGDGDKTTFKGKSVGEVIITDGKDMIISKNKKSSSKALRGSIWIYQNEQGIDDDEFYDKAIKKMILYLPEVMQLLKNKN